MNTPRATVSKLLPFSCVDGPGNRLVLFLQGCNFACLTCHNPHTMALCTHCGDCIPACPTGALELRAGRVEFDPALCTQCDDCLRACPINANPMVREMSLPEVLDVLRENLPFLDGITVSGGEATTQLKFLVALFAAVKYAPDLAHLSCLVDSNGYLGPGGWARLLPVVDGVMLDIKALDAETHRRLTGQDNARVLDSARLLHAAGKLQEIRFLVIPGVTDTEAEIVALTEFLHELDPAPRLRLNAFQAHGVRPPAAVWPTASRDGMEAVAQRLSDLGVMRIETPTVYL
ncbi:YjjW family glycine radical enzyme activase [Tropicimonas sp. TH_r6]|uniref:YjjW family glycine radical enzyme activase n=1 Tax=Tropicimonas sp. TH_r6 TaxID=3082085 RepID=UPI002954C4DE|nr:YjjW family glycine radical enzyme activase [Tropicimonas sp. TH_r6]MDV7144597.1 YjjW family glycine radical enzyme activase [Tropicimonas sp. TH_r6]